VAKVTAGLSRAGHVPGTPTAHLVRLPHLTHLSQVSSLAEIARLELSVTVSGVGGNSRTSLFMLKLVFICVVITKIHW